VKLTYHKQFTVFLNVISTQFQLQQLKIKLLHNDAAKEHKNNINNANVMVPS